MDAQPIDAPGVFDAQPMDARPSDGDGSAPEAGPLDGGTPPPGRGIAGGDRHACALRGAEVWCWGEGASGQLGDGLFASSATPVRASLPAPAAAVAAGEAVSCALMRSGQVMCWGDNARGQVGDGTRDNQRPSPTPVRGLSDAIDVDVAGCHACALRAEGSVVCWGCNDRGQLGNGTLEEALLPTPVPLAGAAHAISVGGITDHGGHACALTTEGFFCWGDAHHGQLGAREPGDQASPVAVIGLATPVAISAGESHTCAIEPSGLAACWGYGALGQLGNGERFDEPTPVGVLDLADAAAIAAGYELTCAATRSHEVRCWGLDEPSGAVHLVATTTPGIEALEIATGANFACALDTAGAVHCWGKNSSGQLGDGTTTGSSLPVRVVGLP